MGLFDVFKNKPQPLPQQQSPSPDFNPLDINSVIEYVHELQPNATAQEVADTVSKLAEPDEDQDHLTPDGDLPWGWYRIHKQDTTMIELRYRKHWQAWFDSRNSQPAKHLANLETFVNCMEQIRKQCVQKGECFNYWRNELFDDEFLASRSKELSEMKENAEALKQEYDANVAFERDILPTLERRLLTIISSSQGILQKDLYKMFDQAGKKYIQEKLYYAEKAGKINREKCGSTYKLYLR